MIPWLTPEGCLSVISTKIFSQTFLPQPLAHSGQRALLSGPQALSDNHLPSGMCTALASNLWFTSSGLLFFGVFLVPLSTFLLAIDLPWRLIIPKSLHKSAKEQILNKRLLKEKTHAEKEFKSLNRPQRSYSSTLTCHVRN